MTTTTQQSEDVPVPNDTDSSHRSTPLLMEIVEQPRQEQHHQEQQHQNDDDDGDEEDPHVETGRFHLVDDMSQLTFASHGYYLCCCKHGSCIYRWWTDCAWPGLGLFGESYLLFSIGILKPLWQELYPDCFNNNANVCQPRLLRSLTYSVVLGIISGMLLVGYLANSMGRRRGSILTATLMSSGAIGLTVVAWGSGFLQTNDGDNPTRLFQCMSILLFVFGIGLGGEYPLSASSASERAMEELRKRRQHEEEKQEFARAAYNAAAVAAAVANTDPPLPPPPPIPLTALDNRGQRIQLVFSMQGCGIFVNTVIMAVLLLLTGQSGNVYNDGRLHLVWRITYAIGAAILFYVLVSRFLYLSESHVWEQDRQDQLAEQQALQQQQQQQAYANDSPSVVSDSIPDSSIASGSFVAMNDAHPQKSQLASRKAPSPIFLLLQHYGMRLFGTSMCWLLWDVAFYGNKLFQSAFLLALTGTENTTLFQFCVAAALNAGVALLGYLGAALLVDRLGRQVLQQCGFFLTGLLFVLCGTFHAKLNDSSSSSSWLILLYLGSSFFGQLGPNCTTFLIPAEIFPTALRTTCHGISAASGKVGALVAAILFNYVTEVNLFLISGICCFMACAISMYALPESKGLDLYEIDKKWHLTLQGKTFEYAGAANDPNFQSFHERSLQRKNS